MNSCWKPQKKLFEVRCAASGEQDYTPKQPAGQSCFTGQCANWIICQHLRVMGLSDGSDPLARMFALSRLTPCDESNRLWRWCSQSGFSDMGDSKAVGTQWSRAGGREGCLSIWQGETCQGGERKQAAAKLKDSWKHKQIFLYATKQYFCCKLECTVTRLAKNEFTGLQCTGIEDVLNEIIRQREDNNLVKEASWKKVILKKTFFAGFFTGIRTDASGSRASEHHHNEVTRLWSQDINAFMSSVFVRYRVFYFLLFVWLLLVFSIQQRALRNRSPSNSGLTLVPGRDWWMLVRAPVVVCLHCSREGCCFPCC